MARDTSSASPFFTGWVVVGIIWIFCSFFAVGLFPVWEGRHTLIRTLKHMVTGKVPMRHTITVGEAAPEEKSSPGTATPEKKLEGKEEAVS